MNEKDKAQELVQKFRDCIDMESEQGFDLKDEKNLINVGCNCAIICAKEQRDLSEYTAASNIMSFWDKVIVELEHIRISNLR